MKTISERIKLNALVRDMIHLLLVTGECAAVKMRDIQTGAMCEVVCVNPLTVESEYVGGRLAAMRQWPDGCGNGGGSIDFALDRCIHFRWNSAGDHERGHSMVTAAFRSVEIMKDLRGADRAEAKRIVSPMRLVKAGGRFGNWTIVPDKRMLDSVRDMLNNMDARGGLVVPFYVSVDENAANGRCLDTVRLAAGIKEEICVALGVPRCVVTCDGANLATPMWRLSSSDDMGFLLCVSR